MTENTKIDHAAEAQKWIDYSADLNPEVDSARIQHAALLGAQHAALAGVEQQRIANLIALAQFRVEGDEGAELWTDFDVATSLHNEVAAALGVSDD